MHRLHDEHGNEVGVYCVIHADMALEALLERIERLERAVRNTFDRIDLPSKHRRP